MRIGVGVKSDEGKGTGVDVGAEGGIGSQQPESSAEIRIRIGIRRFILWFLLQVGELMEFYSMEDYNTPDKVDK
jgi:hypothetical protein